LRDAVENPLAAATEELVGAFALTLAEHLAPLLAQLLEGASPAPDPWLDTQQAADHLGVHADSLRKLAAANTIPSEQEAPGCKRYFLRSELDRWRQLGPRRPSKASTPLPRIGKRA
jgi:excisionase family DNA binding protein